MTTIAVYYNATTRHNFGGEGRTDVELFRDLLQPYMPGVEFITIDSANGEFPEDPSIYDGFIIGGSSSMISDHEPWMKVLYEQIRMIDAEKKPMLGICFGHQAIAHALGGRVADCPITIGSPHLDILKIEPWMHPYMPSIKIYAGNFQQVVDIPASMRRIAMARGNRNALLAKDDHIISLQFHPEFPHMFMEGYADNLLANQEIDLQTHQKAMREIHTGSDAEIMAKWICKFFKRNFEIAEKPRLSVVNAG